MNNKIANLLFTSPDIAEVFLTQTGDEGIELKKNIINNLSLDQIRIICADHLANTVADNVFFYNNKEFIINCLLQYANLLNKDEIKLSLNVNKRFNINSISSTRSMHANHLKAITIFYYQNRLIEPTFCECLRSLSKWDSKDIINSLYDVGENKHDDTKPNEENYNKNLIDKCVAKGIS